jgi:hypothetical protein
MRRIKIILYCLFWLLIYFSIITTGRILIQLLKAANTKFEVTYDFLTGTLMVASGVWLGQLISGHLVKQAKKYFAPASTTIR